MTFTLGRANLGIVSSLDLSGDSLSVAGRLGTGLSFAQAQRLRQQLAGLTSAGRDLVVPVTYTHDSTVDGFYRVEDVNVEAGPGGKLLTFWPWSARLTRVSGYAAPLFESVLVSTVRDNDHGYVAPGETGTDVRPWLGIPPGFDDFSGAIRTGQLEGGERDSQTGTVTVYVDPDMVGEQVRQWGVAPSDWYGGAATVRVSAGTIVGRQTVNAPDTVSLDNGIVRVQATESGGVLVLAVSGWTGAVWSGLGSGWVLRHHDDGDPAFAPRMLEFPSSVSVLWNRPEVASVRLSGRRLQDSTLSGLVPDGRYDLDLSVRRGSRTIDGVLHLSPGSSTRWGVFQLSEMAANTTGGAIYQTGDDARAWLAVCPDPSTAVNTASADEPGLWLDTAPTERLRFAIGTCDTRSSAQAIDEPSEVVRQYMASVAEQVAVSAR